ncbi:MAG: RNA 2',3'-cyclic phosphodiesterase [Gammaproteobacteria bacterium]
MSPQPTEPAQRLFFALWPDADVREAIESVSRRQLRKLAKRTPGEKLHITLAFPGTVTAPVRECLEASAGSIQATPFALAIDRAGYWSRPRIVWVGPSRIPGELWALVKSLRATLGECGLVPESRPFQPHITLARKANRGLPVDEIEVIHWSVGDFCLAESVTDPEGARYRILRRWRLEG